MLNRNSIDVNCDMGEGMDTDQQLFPFISSANISCGAHAGDADVLRRTVALAMEHGVSIGAHPSFPDRAGFGRTDMLAEGRIRPEDLRGILLEQLEFLQNICGEFGTRIRHVKPHGALYNRAAKDSEVSRLIGAAIIEFDPALLLVGLSGSQTKAAAGETGLQFVSEAFADRTYQPDGSLTPRSWAHALIGNTDAAVAQALAIVREGKVRTVGGEDGTGRTQDIFIEADTICLHGDGAHAVEFARALHAAFKREGIRIKCLI